MEKKTQDLYKEVATLREENQNLKTEMEKLKKQMETLRNLYADEEKEELTKKGRLRNNIQILEEEKSILQREVEELRRKKTVEKTKQEVKAQGVASSLKPRVGRTIPRNQKTLVEYDGI